jgi:hypothetical protein
LTWHNVKCPSHLAENDRRYIDRTSEIEEILVVLIGIYGVGTMLGSIATRPFTYSLKEEEVVKEVVSR